MKKLIQTLTIVSLMLALVPVAAFAHTEDDPSVAELIAGGGNEKSAMDVGQVEVWNDADHLYFKYETSGDWCLAETHLQVATSLDGIPQKNGNPIPGQFAYKMTHDCDTEYTYAIPITWDVGTNVLIAAHGVVQTLEGGLDGLEADLPEMVSMSVVRTEDGFGDPSYFDVTISGGTVLDGTYDNWCITTDRYITQGETYTANVYSSYEALPAGLVDFPENLDLVNWIINQHFVGQPSACGGTYTYGDVQKAIWELIDDDPTGGGLGPVSMCRVEEIVAGALAFGEGFVPGCGDVVAVILVPGDLQLTIAEVPIPCEFAEETAWGDGLDFPGKNWATYFEYEVQ